MVENDRASAWVNCNTIPGKQLSRQSKLPFYVGDWCVIPDQCQLQSNQQIKHIQPKLMDVLLHLSEHPNQVISTDDLIEACWMGLPMNDNPIHKTIAQLRKALGDSSDIPRYIKTIPRKGYMLIARVAAGQNNSSPVDPYWLDHPPFPGQHGFRSHHKDIFFGREPALRACLKLIERLGPKDNCLLHLSGASGCGKSSFIRAGILPRLLNPYKPFKLTFTGAIDWDLSVHTEVRSLLQVLHQHGLFSAAVSEEALWHTWQQEPQKLLHCLTAKPAAAEKTVLFIDQLEHWLSGLHQDAALRIRVDGLWQLLEYLQQSQRFLIIMACRDETGAALQDALQPVCEHWLEYRLAEMKIIEQLEWLEQTVQAAGLFFAVQADRQQSLLDLLRHLMERHHFSTATMQQVMKQLYESREVSQLSFNALYDAGGVEGIMEARYEGFFAALEPDQQRAVYRLFPWLIGLESVEHNRPALKHQPHSLVCELVGAELCGRLIDARLLKTTLRGQQVSVGFQEKHMPQLWRRLGQWVKEHQQPLRQQLELQFLCRRWQRAGKPRSGLLSAADHRRYQAAFSQLESRIPDDLQGYLQASLQGTQSSRWRQAAAILLIGGLAAGWLWSHRAHLDSRDRAEQSGTQLMALSNHLTEQVGPELKARGAWQLLQESQTRLLTVYQQIPVNQHTERQLINHATTLNTLGELSFNQRDQQQASAYFKQAVNLLTDNPHGGIPMVMNQLMLSHYWLGYLAFSERDHQRTAIHWQQYLHIAKELRRLEPGKSQWTLEHSYALNNLGSMYEKTGQLEQAAAHFARSIELKQNLARQQPDDLILLADLADSLSWQGNIFRKQGALKQALEAYQESAVLTARLPDKSKSGTTKLHRESLASHRMAVVHFDLGQVSEAQALASEAIARSQQLNQLEPENNDHKKELIGLHLLNATINRHTGDFDAALNHIQQASELIDYFRLNLQMTPKIAAYQMRVKQQQAQIFHHYGQPESAEFALQQGLQTWQDHDLSAQRMARVAYVMLNLHWARLRQARFEVTDTAQIDHLEEAWQHITQLLAENPEDRQLMAIHLAFQHARTGTSSHPEYIKSLQESEYRNPEYYQPLIDQQLISYH
jgi:DNA-binding winged helix-turn-helix (wHTH) protein/tetratricopeptide (TPR) repeat protein